jgi:hypothetical protein
MFCSSSDSTGEQQRRFISANDLLQDVASALGPDEKPGIGVVMGGVGVPSGDQLWHAE